MSWCWSTGGDVWASPRAQARTAARATNFAIRMRHTMRPMKLRCTLLLALVTVPLFAQRTQKLIFDPHAKRVIGLNALGVAPTGATPAYYQSKGLAYPPEYGPLAAVTPGTPGGLMTMLAEYGKLSLADVLGPAIQLADGYAIEAGTANNIERNKAQIKQWPYSRQVMLPHLGQKREAPE